jgi:hypothetical protein
MSEEQTTEADEEKEKSDPSTENKPTTEEKNPFEVDLDAGDDAEEPEKTEEAEEQEEADELEFGDTGYSENEQKMLGDLVKKHGLPNKAMSGFLRDLAQGLGDNQRAQSEELKKQWGDQFETRTKDVAKFLVRIAKSAGWSKEFTMSMQNAQTFRVFYDIMRVTGESKVKTTRGTEVSAKDAPMSIAEAQRLQSEATNEYYAARRVRDAAAVRAASDKHLRALEAEMRLKGSKGKAPRFFPIQLF